MFWRGSVALLCITLLLFQASGSRMPVPGAQGMQRLAEVPDDRKTVQDASVMLPIRTLLQTPPSRWGPPKEGAKPVVIPYTNPYSGQTYGG